MSHIGPLFKVACVQDHVGKTCNNDFFFFFFFLFQAAPIIQIISNVQHKDLPVPCVCSRQVNFRPHSFPQSRLHRKGTGSRYDKERNQMKNQGRKGKRQIRHMCRIKPDLFWKLIQCHHVTAKSRERKFLPSSCHLTSATERTLQSCIRQMQGEFEARRNGVHFKTLWRTLTKGAICNFCSPE